MNEIEYPEDPPLWLDKWPSGKELSERFAEGIPDSAFRLSISETNLKITFTPRCLHATIGGQHARWRLDDERGWECECSCHSPVPCVHAYLAIMMFRKVCREEGWQTAEDRPKKEPALVKKTEIIPVQKPATSPKVQATFFNEVGNDFTHAKPQADKPVHKCSLEFRANFKESDRAVIGVFRTTENGIKSDRTLSWIRECGNEIVKGVNSLYEWSDEDAALLRAVFPYLNPNVKPNEWRLSLGWLNGTRWFISYEDFAVWLQRKSPIIQRIIEDRTGIPIMRVMPFLPQRLLIRLGEASGVVRVECLFDIGQGKLVKYHELNRMEQEDNSGYVSFCLRKMFKSPVPLFNLVTFANGSVSMVKDRICTFLGEKLAGHFELIEEGRLVVHEKMQTNGAFAELSYDGYNFKIHCSNSQDISDAKSRISLRNGIFHVLTYEENKEEKTELVNRNKALRALAEKFRENTQGSYHDDIYFCRATYASAVELQKFWQAIPKGVDKKVDASVQSLFGNDVSLLMNVSIIPKGRFVQTSVSCRYGNDFVPYAEILSAAKVNRGIVKTAGGSWLSIDPGAMADAIRRLNEQGILEDGAVMFPEQAKKVVGGLGGALCVDDKSVAFAKRLCASSFPEVVVLPKHFEGVLRPYQKAGFAFLAERCRYGVGSILADDMGLGKTVQMLALLEACRAKVPGRFRALVITPASVVDVWLQQAAQFCQGIRAVAMRGNKAQRRKALESDAYEILVTHYGLARSDVKELSSVKFDFVILDEAQAIKNPDAQVSQAVRGLEAECRMVLTGTPLENSLKDLWSIMDFINPGIFGELKDFMLMTEEVESYSRIKRMLSMLMLRRKKGMVAKELPPKTVEVVSIEMDDDTRKQYNVELVKARLQSEADGRMGLFAALTKLRRFACSPELVDGTPKGLHSAKLDYLMEHIGELIDSGHSALVFSQFTSMLDIIKKKLEENGIRYFEITGETPVATRAGIADEFNNCGEASVFLLSLKAAGTGLTLTRADYVFMYDPWWNPAAENQAIDRTHRIGQDKPVFAYRLVLKGTVEEKVLQIVEAKRKLFNDVIDDTDASGIESRLTLEELKGLLS